MLEVSGVNIDEYLIDGLTYTNVYFECEVALQVIAEKINFDVCIFTNVDFTYGSFEHCNFRNVEFINCSISATGFEDCTFENVKFEGCNAGMAIDFKRCMLKNVTFENSEIEGINISNEKEKEVKQNVG